MLPGIFDFKITNLIAVMKPTSKYSVPPITDTDQLIVALGLRYNVMGFTSTCKYYLLSVIFLIAISFAEAQVPVNNALHFDGINDRVEIPNNTLLNTPHITVQVWFKIDYIGTYDGVVTKRNCCDDYTTFQWSLQTSPSGHLSFAVNIGSPLLYGVSDPNPLIPGEWIHYSVTYDGYTVCMYKNGLLIVTNSGREGDIVTMNWPVTIGDRNGGSDWFPGSIDEVRIWNRALTQQQIQANINCELTGNEPGLIAYYNFNQGIPNSNNTGITILNDQTPNHLNGSLQNFALNGSTSNWVTPSAFAPGTHCILTYYQDFDGDGYGNPLVDSISITPPAGYVLDNSDCNDSNVNIHPGATEICGNNIDEDCNGIAEACGAALHFDGIDDRVSVPDNDAFDLTAFKKFTIEFWLYRPPGSPLNVYHVMGKRIVCTPNNINWQIVSDDNAPSGGYFGLGWGGSSNLSITRNPAIPLGVWTHIAFTCDSSFLKLYINGNLENSVIVTSNVGPVNNDPLIIGQSGSCSGGLNAAFDEIRFWNYARSQTQIQSAMNCEISTAQTGLVANYHFNQGVAGGNNASPPINTLIDASGYNNNGTLNNFALTGNTSNWIMSLVFAPLSSPGPITGPAPVCAGQTGITYYITSVIGATSYTWTVPPGDTIISGQGDTSIVVNFGSVPGNITVAASNDCALSANSTLAVALNLGTLAAATGSVQVCANRNVSAGGTFYMASPCDLVAKVVPSGAIPVNGSIKACVIIDGSIQYYNAEPYVQRHYDIEPANNPATATGTVTLYFKDQEFENFNAVNTAWPDLPTVAGGGNSDPNISKLRVTQYHGIPIAPHNVGNPAPGFYTTSTGVLLTPTLVNYNSTNGYWEVTLQVNGFSGFYVHSNIYGPLPITLNYFTGARQAGRHVLSWKVACNATQRATLILERSPDSRSFTSIYSITADTLRCQQSFEYTDAQPIEGMNYYRLKIVDADGKITYSNIVALLNSEKGFQIVNIIPNPVTTGSNLKLNMASVGISAVELIINDMQGRVIKRHIAHLTDGFNIINLQVAHLSIGTYIISAFTNDNKLKVFRFVKL
jgi:hypothetical protein